MSDAEREIEALEDQFPYLSAAAFAAARETVLASGQSVLQSEDGHIYRVFPDGRRERAKPVEPPTAVKPGTRLAIR